MAYFAVKDANGNIIYLTATGSGTTGDPYVPTHALDTEDAALLADLLTNATFNGIMVPFATQIDDANVSLASCSAFSQVVVATNCASARYNLKPTNC